MINIKKGNLLGFPLILSSIQFTHQFISRNPIFRKDFFRHFQNYLIRIYRFRRFFAFLNNVWPLPKITRLQHVAQDYQHDLHWQKVAEKPVPGPVPIGREIGQDVVSEVSLARSWNDVMIFRDGLITETTLPGVPRRFYRYSWFFLLNLFHRAPSWAAATSFSRKVSLLFSSPIWTVEPWLII